MMKAVDKVGYVRRDEAAKLLSVSIRTIAEWQAKRFIPYAKIGGNVLFKITDLESFVDRFRVEAAGV